MKNRILNWIYKINVIFFESKVDLDKIFENNKHYFELLLVKDFIGHIPKDINEPALKIFEEYGEVFERWTLWQSWYINRKAINDPLKISFYSGMMVYLKILNTLARVNKKTYQPVQVQGETKVGLSMLDEALQELKEFNDKIKQKNEDTKNDTNAEDASNS